MTTGKQLGSEPALPFAQVTEAFTTAYNQHRGTTKRELAAMVSLQGLLATGMPPSEYLCEQAVKAADLLCDELAKDWQP